MATNAHHPFRCCHCLLSAVPLQQPPFYPALFCSILGCSQSRLPTVQTCVHSSAERSPAASCGPQDRLRPLSMGTRPFLHSLSQSLLRAHGTAFKPGRLDSLSPEPFSMLIFLPGILVIRTFAFSLSEMESQWRGLKKRTACANVRLKAPSGCRLENRLWVGSEGPCRRRPGFH